MNEDFNNIFGEMKRASLTESERAGMRNNLQAYMHENPARAPLSLRFRDALGSYAGYFDTSHAAMRFAPATLALVLVVGVGTSYAAENAVPGDILYPVKLSLNEPVRSALAVSQSAKAEWNTKVLSRRLEEAEMLAAEDRLTPVARSEIQARIVQSADRFDESVRALAETEDGAAAVATAQSNLEASLDGHEQVLAALSADASSSEYALQPLLKTVRAQASEAGIARKLIESHISSRKGDGNIKAAALNMEVAADDALERVRAKVKAYRSTNASSSIKAARMSASDAEESIVAGDQKIKEGEYGEAFTSFQAAIRTTQSAQVHLDATQRLKTDLSIEENTSGNDGDAEDAAESI